MMKKITLGILYCFGWIVGTFFAPQQAFSQDSLRLAEVYKMLWANHPLVKQATLVPELFSQDVRYRRGFFDPVIASSWIAKDFKEKNYYNKFQIEAKLPVYYGFDIKAGFETQEGYFTNPESTLPAEGLLYAGVSVPLMRSLFFDERRAELQKAKIFHQASFAEKQKLLSALFWRVAAAFWDWYKSYEILKINKEGLDLAQKRFDFVRGASAFGKYAAIDTTEALMEYRRRLTDYEKSVLENKNAALALSVHLYGENNEMLSIGESLIPSSGFNFSTNFVEDLKNSALPNHPEILKNQFKLAANKTDRNLAFFNLLPELDVEFKPLFLPTSPKLNFADHKIGANFYFPLLLRKERAKFAASKIKILQQEQEVFFVKNAVFNYFEQVFNEKIAYEKILKAQTDNTTSAEQLTKAEQEKFELGISNVFLINYRERYLLDNKIKAAEIQAKYFSIFAKLFYAAGTFPPMEQ